MSDVENFVEADNNDDIIISYLTDYLNDSQLERFRQLISTSESFRNELAHCIATLAITDCVIDEEIRSL